MDMKVKVKTCNFVRGEDGGDMSNIIHFRPLHEAVGRGRTFGQEVQDFLIVRLSNCELWEHVGTVNHDPLLLS